jgi:hypothetical protein
MVMKKLILCIGIIFCVGASSAQSVQKKSTTKKQGSNAIAKQNSKKLATQQTATNTTTYLSANNSYAAKANPTSVSVSSRYGIADPTINALTARANGADVRIGKSGIVGMPKRAYGFANGHLALFTTGATSSGTITGTGAVGTGSSLGSIGSFGPSIGLNGKSPYAGATMWGNATGLLVRHADSAVRVGGRQ